MFEVQEEFTQTCSLLSVIGAMCIDIPYVIELHPVCTFEFCIRVCCNIVFILFGNFVILFKYIGQAHYYYYYCFLYHVYRVLKGVHMGL